MNSSHQQTTKLTILACSDSRDSWFNQEDARDVCPAAPWTRCVSGWRCVSAPSFQGRSSTTTKCVCGRSRALHKWCSAQTAFSPSTTPLDQRRPRMRCMSPAYSPWWRPWLAAITPPSSATDKQGQGRHTHWRGETWVGWRLARGSSIVLIDSHFKQGFGISFSVLLGSCFLATARLAHNSILRVLNTQCTVDWISGGQLQRYWSSQGDNDEKSRQPAKKIGLRSFVLLWMELTPSTYNNQVSHNSKVNYWSGCVRLFVTSFFQLFWLFLDITNSGWVFILGVFVL